MEDRDQRSEGQQPTSSSLPTSPKEVRWTGVNKLQGPAAHALPAPQTRVQRPSGTPTKPKGFAKVGEVSSVASRKRRQEQQNRLNEILSSLPEEERRLYLANPHLQQVAACRLPLQRKPLFTAKDRLLDLKTAPRAPYRPRNEEIKTLVHSGQRKLLITEIEFLSRFSLPNDVVIYAGAAGGFHQKILAELFKQVLFVLYDPQPFTVQPTPMREIHQNLFTTQTAQQLSLRFQREGRRILFISDIRRVEEGSSELDRQKLIIEDLEAQRVWMEILKPAASLLKFVMPYPIEGIPEHLGYSDGTIFLQPWVGATSTETRLLVLDQRTEVDYDVKQYEEVLAYHNQITRATYYEAIEGVPPDQVGCHCYDCASELFVLNQYARRQGAALRVDVKGLVRELDRLFQ